MANTTVLKASLVAGVVVRPYATGKVWVQVWLRNGRALSATKTSEDWRQILNACLRNDIPVDYVGL